MVDLLFFSIRGTTESHLGACGALIRCLIHVHNNSLPLSDGENFHIDLLVLGIENNFRFHSIPGNTKVKYKQCTVLLQCLISISSRCALLAPRESIGE